MDAEGPSSAPGDQLSELERERRTKAARLTDAGIELFARRYEPRTRAAEIVARHGDLVTGEEAVDAHYRLAGRVLSRREHG